MTNHNSKRKTKVSNAGTWYIYSGPDKGPNRFGKVVIVILLFGFMATTGFLVRELKLEGLGLLGIPVAAGIFWLQVIAAYSLYERIAGRS
jgi:hypothetical protein